MSIVDSRQGKGGPGPIGTLKADKSVPSHAVIEELALAQRWVRRVSGTLSPVLGLECERWSLATGLAPVLPRIRPSEAHCSTRDPALARTG